MKFYCVEYCQNAFTTSLKLIALKVLEEELGHNCVQELLSYTFDKEMNDIYNKPCVWWAPF